MLFFGKSRAFSATEFESQIKFHKVTLAKEYSDKVSVIINGRMMTPYEQIESDRLYEKYSKEIEFISIDELEKELAKYIDPNTLLMSLKLSRDKDRLKSFLQNSTLSNELFFKLLKMYSWGGEDFFENDNNRDVAAALISRFYKNIDRNHNVQYATTGLLHLLLQNDDEELIEAISELEPLQKSFKDDAKDTNYNILRAIARHEKAPKKVLNKLIKKANTEIKVLVAIREDCDASMQKALYDCGEDILIEALSHNAYLDKEIAHNLMSENLHVENVAQYINLDNEIFLELIENYSVYLAKNTSLASRMQQSLLELNNLHVKVALASNEHTNDKAIAELVSENIQEINNVLYSNPSTPSKYLIEAYENELNYISLASNENTPWEVLIKLANTNDIKVLENLAKNISTPIDVLYQLQLDSRVERYVKENETFGKHIQQNSIGWEV